MKAVPLAKPWAAVRPRSSELVAVKLAAEHAKKAHNLDVTPEMAAQVRALIRNEEP